MMIIYIEWINKEGQGNNVGCSESIHPKMLIDVIVRTANKLYSVVMIIKCCKLLGSR